MGSVGVGTNPCTLGVLFGSIAMSIYSLGHFSCIHMNVLVGASVGPDQVCLMEEPEQSLDQVYLSISRLRLSKPLIDPPL